MNERARRVFFDFEKALKNLKQAVKVAQDNLTIDGTIKRFELTFEISWKLMKAYLEDLGIICKNPRDCFKQAYLNGLIDDETVWMKMIDDRNLLVHTYTLEESRGIFANVKKIYLKQFECLYNKVSQEVEGESE